MRTLIGIGIIVWLGNNMKLTDGWAALTVVAFIAAIFQDLKELFRE